MLYDQLFPLFEYYRVVKSTPDNSNYHCHRYEVMREVPLSLNSREFLTSVLKEGLRPDAREGYDYRDIKITYGSQWGHAEVGICFAVVQI